MALFARYGTCSGRSRSAGGRARKVHDVEQNFELLPSDAKSQHAADAWSSSSDEEDASAAAVHQTRPSPSSAEKSADATTLLGMLRNRTACAWFLVQLWSWCACSMLYYGLTMAAGDITPDRAFNVAVSGLVELPAYVLTYAVQARLAWEKAQA